MLLYLSRPRADKKALWGRGAGAVWTTLVCRTVEVDIKTVHNRNSPLIQQHRFIFKEKCCSVTWSAIWTGGLGINGILAGDEAGERKWQGLVGEGIWSQIFGCIIVTKKNKAPYMSSRKQTRAARNADVDLLFISGATKWPCIFFII